MKYWPLTAVLLAFWMGRETGADAPTVARFDRIIAREITVEDGKKRTRVTGEGIAIGINGEAQLRLSVEGKGDGAYGAISLFGDKNSSATRLTNDAYIVKGNDGSQVFIMCKRGKAGVTVSAAKSPATIYIVTAADTALVAVNKKDGSGMAALTGEGLKKE